MGIMKAKVYIETTIPSYVTARPSGNSLIAAHQHFTKDWWVSSRNEFDFFISQPVLDEAGAGDPSAAAERLKLLAGLPLLEVTDVAINLAAQFSQKVPLPSNAAVDALHMGLAAVHNIDYLLTWNCRHIANAKLRPMIEYICGMYGFRSPVICTPLELCEEAL
jgi:hypothetical protein